MDSLREKSIEKIFDVLFDNRHSVKGSEELANIILDLPSLDAYFREKQKAEPSGVVEKKECSCFERFAGRPWSECPSCHGTGIISRELNKDELAEVPKMLLDGGATLEEIIKPPKISNVRYILLPSGERLELKEGG